MNLFKMERYFQLACYGDSFSVSKIFFYISKIGFVLELLFFCLYLADQSHSWTASASISLLMITRLTSLFSVWQLLFRLRSWFVWDISLGLGVSLNSLWQDWAAQSSIPKIIFTPVCFSPSLLPTRTSEMHLGPLWSFYQNITGRTVFLTHAIHYW